MSSQPIFYKKIIPLNKETHGDFSVEAVSNYKHTSETNSIFIAAIEFKKAAKEYPIVFGIGENDSVFPVILLGLRKNENLYINKKGEWLARYVPAYVRRYPFILASDMKDPDKFVVCIDSDCPGFNNKGKGTKLFDDGNDSDLLKSSIEFLKDYQNHILLTTEFCKNIKELGLLEPMKLDAKSVNGEELSIGGILGINREKLNSLSTEAIDNLFKTGQLELVYLHLNSMENIQTLLENLSES